MTLPYERVYWGDFLRETLHLSQAQIGALTLMRAAYWSRGGPLPDDDRALAAITKSPTIAHWRKHIRPALEQLFEVRRGLWRHAALDAELAEAVTAAAASSSRATKAALERWSRERQKRLDLDARSMREASAEHAPGMLGECSGDAPSSSSSDPESDSPSPPPVTPPGESAGGVRLAEPRRLSANQREIEAAEAFYRDHDLAPPPAKALVAMRKQAGGGEQLLTVLRQLGAPGLRMGQDYVHAACLRHGRGDGRNGHAADSAPPPPEEEDRFDALDRQLRERARERAARVHVPG